MLDLQNPNCSRRAMAQRARPRGTPHVASHRCAADCAACMPVETISRSIGRATRHKRGHATSIAGDGVMSVFGVEGTAEAAVRSALQAALEVWKGVDILSRELASELEAPLRIGVGIHAGTAVVGLVRPAKPKRCSFSATPAMSPPNWRQKRRTSAVRSSYRLLRSTGLCGTRLGSSRVLSQFRERATRSRLLLSGTQASLSGFSPLPIPEDRMSRCISSSHPAWREKLRHDESGLVFVGGASAPTRALPACLHRWDAFEHCPIRRLHEALRPDGNLAKTRRPYFSSGRAQAYVRPIPCSPLPRGALFQHQ